MVYDNYKFLSRPFRRHWGAGWDGLQQAPLDDVFYLWNTSSITRLVLVLVVGDIGPIFS